MGPGLRPGDATLVATLRDTTGGLADADGGIWRDTWGETAAALPADAELADGVLGVYGTENRRKRSLAG